MQPASPTPMADDAALAAQSTAPSQPTPAALPQTKPRARWVTITGFGFIGLSVVFFILFFVVTFLPVSVGVKGIMLLVCWIGSESSFGIGGVLLGVQFVRRFRRYFNPVNWFRRAPKAVATPEATPAE
jgi:hypothetical protein